MIESERPQMAIWLRVACWISNATGAQAHASARAPTATPTHARTHTHALANTHTHTQKYVILLAFAK